MGRPAPLRLVDTLIVCAFASSAVAGGAGPARTDLRAEQLRGGWAYREPVALAAYGPAAGAGPARQAFEGRLTLRGMSHAPGFRAYVDEYGVASASDAAVRRLPEFDFEFVQVDGSLVPTRRGAIPGGHPYWEFVLGTGRVWYEENDGAYSRAALPFSLEEVNANCLHNGVLTFLFTADGEVSRAAYQVSSETCAYFKADLWGQLEATYAPHAVAGRDRLIGEYRREVAGRLPRRPITDLARDFPGVDPADFAHHDEVSAAHLTTWGVVADGVHYSGGCPTRAGPHPFCNEAHLPSFSLAKSMFASLALMRLEKLHPGVRARPVTEFVPECRASGNWSDVTLENLLDMASGNYRSAADQADEYARHADERFFMRQTVAEKLDYACNFFPRAATPGARWVYRTSDTFLLGVAMNRFLKRERGPQADLVEDLVRPDLWRPMGLSPGVEVVRRTRDPAAQPFTGYGLVLLPDDVAKLARFFAGAGPEPERLLDAGMYRAALQRDPADRGLAAAGDGSLRYNHGFWAWRVTDLPGCDGEQFVPFMSGYGGISLVLMPNGVGYYYFSDNREFRFRRAVFAAAGIHNYCRPPGGQPDSTEGHRHESSW